MPSNYSIATHIPNTAQGESHRLECSNWPVLLTNKNKKTERDDDAVDFKTGFCRKEYSVNRKSLIVIYIYIHEKKQILYRNGTRAVKIVRSAVIVVRAVLYYSRDGDGVV